MPRKKNEPAIRRMFGQRDVLYVPLYFALCLNLEQYDEVLDHLNIKMRDRDHFLPIRGQCAHVQIFNAPNDGKWSDELRGVSSTTAVVNFRPYNPDKDPIGIVGLLAHEAVHIWQECERLYGDLGVEGEAYFIQHITQELVRLYPVRYAEHLASESAK